MQQFTVPQFIDVEDKIIGPITTRQFIILLAVALIIFILFKLLAFIPFVIASILLFAMGGTLAFVRINGQPFHFFLLNILQTWRSPNIQIWDKRIPDALLRQQLKTPLAPVLIHQKHKEQVASSRLAEIALTVDTGGVYTPET